MTETPESVIAPPKKGGRQRLFFYTFAILIIAVVILAAAKQEELGTFFRLKLWDQGAAGRTVTDFLNAGKKGDQAGATKMLGASSYKPLTENGKFVGYSMMSMAGNMKFLFSDLIGTAEPKVLETEFVPIGSYAKVSIADAKGKPIKYRVEMIEGSWKITEILSGRPFK